MIVTQMQENKVSQAKLSISLIFTNDCEGDDDDEDWEPSTPPARRRTTSNRHNTGRADRHQSQRQNTRVTPDSDEEDERHEHRRRRPTRRRQQRRRAVYHDHSGEEDVDDDVNEQLKRGEHTSTPVSLLEFNAAASDLWLPINQRHKEPSLREAYIRYVLCGQISEHKYVNITMAGNDLNVAEAKLSRDYDSIIVVSNLVGRMCIDLALVVTLQSRKALKKKLHVKAPFDIWTTNPVAVSNERACLLLCADFIQNQHSEVLKDPGTLPNVYLGSYGTRSSLYLILPNLVDNLQRHDGVPSVTVVEYSEIYKALKAAFQRHKPSIGNRLPGSYAHKEFQAGKGQGHQVRELTELLSPATADAVLQEVWEAVVKLPWGRGARFLTIWRGIKTVTAHDPSDELKRDEYLADPGTFDRGAYGNDANIWVDVGFELSVPGHAIVIRSDAHAILLMKILGIDRQVADEWTRFGYTNYNVDPSSHLTSVAGCHIIVHGDGLGPFLAMFIQFYTSDKALTYDTRCVNNSKFMTGKDAMRNTGQFAYHPFLRQLYDQFVKGAENNDVLARFEVRVPFQHANKVGKDLRVRDFHDAVYCLDREPWW